MNKTVIFYLPFIILSILSFTGYYLGWNVMFYISSSLISVSYIFILMLGLFTHRSFLYWIFQISLCLIYIEVGYLLTGELFRGILLGFSIMPFLAVIELIIKREKEYK